MVYGIVSTFQITFGLNIFRISHPGSKDANPSQVLLRSSSIDSNPKKIESIEGPTNCVNDVFSLLGSFPGAICTDCGLSFDWLN